MFKAIDISTGQPVISLDSRDQDRLNDLRCKGRRNALHCQVCSEPVLLKAGAVRRPHFAHKELADCPIQNESPAILEARAVLYEWLKSKFGEAVTLERTVEGHALPRAMDCWAEYGEYRFAYWLLDRRLRPDTRGAIAEAARAVGASINWVFLSAMLRRLEADDRHLQLSTTERELAIRSEFDQLYEPWAAGSLHYLNAEAKRLNTFRGMLCIHRPQVHTGHEIQNRLEAVLVSPKTGEFVHPGEHEKLRAHLQRIREAEARQLQQARTREARRQQQQRRIWEAGHTSRPPSAPFARPEVPKATRQEAGVYENREGVCEFCGQATREWWYYDGKTGKCRCYQCQNGGRSSPQDDA